MSDFNKPKTIVFKVSDNIKDKMVSYYEKNYILTKPPYTIFQAKAIDCTITLYEKGKVMFQGIGADIEASIWMMEESKKNDRNIESEIKEEQEKKEKKKDKILDDGYHEEIKVSSIGSDEVGTGDYFGPLVVTASFVPKDLFTKLNELGVKDSKKLTDEKIATIAPTLIKEVSHTTLVVSNKEYNDYKKKNINMNQMKAILHNKCLLEEVKKNHNYYKIVVDMFEPPKAYFNHLTGTKEVVKNIKFMTKAEDYCYSVAASSIISRYVFLLEMKKISDEYKMPIPFGASDKVDQVGKELVKKYGEEVLYKIAKKDFKNTNKILNGDN